MDPLRIEKGALEVLDQTLLPERESWIAIDGAAAMADAIARLAVRGAPAIGIAAALALAAEARRRAGGSRDPASLLAALRESGARLRATRPTAVNLAWAVDRTLAACGAAAAEGADAGAIAARAQREAEAIWEEDRAASRAMAAHGAALLGGRRRFLTHCNTGGLATGGGGTALGVILEVHRRHPGAVEVWHTETRPLLQGARLTAWELVRAGVQPRLIADGAAAHVIAREGIEAVLVGADRIARNGDVANKIGTYGLALAAHASDVPFIVVAPTSTMDPSLEDGASIPIEERDSSEVTLLRGIPTAAPGVLGRNPAFDVTPARFVSWVVTERGAARPGEVPAAVVDRVV
ncbi:MAG TPA: S-methyl-5-thioribose-1-phosphate isomerase [Candidatus Binatia bacterium]|nr:S-methyl-5-thioribose-1-phosphate isomerase [Candidatus Binatia bacterium]